MIIIEPVAKPRMNKADSWKKRPCVLRYWEYADKLRKFKLDVDWEHLELTFHLPMPASWSEKKRFQMLGTKHEPKPDLNNLVKSFEDILLKNDSKIWHYENIRKLWGREGAIYVKCKG